MSEHLLTRDEVNVDPWTWAALGVVCPGGIHVMDEDDPRLLQEPIAAGDGVTKADILELGEVRPNDKGGYDVGRIVLGNGPEGVTLLDLSGGPHYPSMVGWGTPYPDMPPPVPKFGGWTPEELYEVWCRSCGTI